MLDLRTGLLSFDFGLTTVLMRIGKHFRMIRKAAIETGERNVR